jgi:hypothetical protein
MKVHLLALVPLIAVLYFWLTFENLIAPLPFESLIWLAGFGASIEYFRRITKKPKQGASKRAEDQR